MLLRTAVKKDVAWSTTEATRASATTAACFMESAARTTNPCAPQRTHVRVVVVSPSSAAGSVAVTPTVSSTTSAVQITRTTVTKKNQLR